MPNLNSLKPWTLRWPGGEALIEAVGAMLAPVTFDLGDNRRWQPFSVFPWADEAPPPGEAPLQGLMQRGRGEWPCVPFGRYESPATGAASSDWPHPIHGEAAHRPWTRMDDASDPAFIRLRYDFAPDAPIVSLVREIRGALHQPAGPMAAASSSQPIGAKGAAAPEPGSASALPSSALLCRLIITPRRDIALPIGLHPCLALPDTHGNLRLQVPNFAFAASYPTEVEPQRDVLKPGAIFHDLSRAPRQDGGVQDLTLYPWQQDSESLVQLCALEQGELHALDAPLGLRWTLRWDAKQLPSCVLWISHRGRQTWPWSGRNLTLGIEPVCSAFDLGVQASTTPNLISQRGIPTALPLQAGKPLTLDYSMTVSGL